MKGIAKVKYIIVDVFKTRWIPLTLFTLIVEHYVRAVLGWTPYNQFILFKILGSLYILAGIIFNVIQEKSISIEWEKRMKSLMDLERVCGHKDD